MEKFKSNDLLAMWMDAYRSGNKAKAIELFNMAMQDKELIGFFKEYNPEIKVLGDMKNPKFNTLAPTTDNTISPSTFASNNKDDMEVDFPEYESPKQNRTFASVSSNSESIFQKSYDNDLANALDCLSSSLIDDGDEEETGYDDDYSDFVKNG